jgi:hypothetical protein
MKHVIYYYSNCGLPSPRPNSMNKYGLILNSIGLANTFTNLQKNVLNVISKHLFPEIGKIDKDHQAHAVFLFVK